MQLWRSKFSNDIITSIHSSLLSGCVNYLLTANIGAACAIRQCQITTIRITVLRLQALRPERLLSSMETFVSRVLNLKELSPPALSLKNVLRETTSDEPVLIIISSGSDPSEELRELAQKTQQVNPFWFN